jgi:hypothetical protein
MPYCPLDGTELELHDARRPQHSSICYDCPKCSTHWEHNVVLNGFLDTTDDYCDGCKKMPEEVL